MGVFSRIVDNCSLYDKGSFDDFPTVFPLSRGIAETGVDYISVGRITQSAPAVDIGLDYSLAKTA